MRVSPVAWFAMFSCLSQRSVIIKESRTVRADGSRFSNTTDLLPGFWYACGALLTRGFTLFMSGWRKIYYKILNLPLKLLVRSKVIPSDPVTELGLDPSRPILYVLPYNSKADLLTLRTVPGAGSARSAQLAGDRRHRAAELRVHSRRPARVPLLHPERRVGKAVPRLSGSAPQQPGSRHSDAAGFGDVRPLAGPRRPRHAAPASVERRAEILRRAVARPRQLRAFLQHRFAAPHGHRARHG